MSDFGNARVLEGDVYQTKTGNRFVVTMQYEIGIYVIWLDGMTSNMNIRWFNSLKPKLISRNKTVTVSVA